MLVAVACRFMVAEALLPAGVPYAAAPIRRLLDVTGVRSSPVADVKATPCTHTPDAHEDVAAATKKDDALEPSSRS